MKFYQKPQAQIISEILFDAGFEVIRKGNVVYSNATIEEANQAMRESGYTYKAQYNSSNFDLLPCMVKVS